MAAVSLDRYVKVYDCRKNKQVFQAYLKNRLNCTLLMGHVDIEDSNDEDSDDYNSGDDSADGDVVEEFVDSSSEEEEEEEEQEEENSYADIEPTGRKLSNGSKKNSSNKKQKRR
jgi:hypothetical protein